MNSLETSGQALRAVGQRKEGSQMARIEAVVLGVCRNGRKDISMREIQAELRRVHSVDMEMSSISARVNKLVSAKRLVRCGYARQCSVSGVDIHPLAAPVFQARLVA